MRDSILERVIGHEECFEIVRKKLRDDSTIDDFRLVDYEIIPIDEINGYMGQYFTLRTTINCNNESSSIERVYNFFTKIPPPISSPQYDWSREYGSFKKEIDLYTIVFPKILHNLEKKSIPECFFSHEDNIIVLDDMAQSGYAMTDKFVPFELEHCRIVMKTLAKFHAKTIIYEELEKKNLHDEFSRSMPETLWPFSLENDSGRSKRMFDAAVKGVLSLIDLVENLDAEQRLELRKNITSRASNHVKKLLPSDKHRNVLCHGDLWANNILFRYNENGKPEACCLIDFQLARYNPPAHDILCFLQFTTTRKFREKHDEHLYQYYWDRMAESLEDAGLDAATIFPWKNFVVSINDLRPMSMTHGILNIPLMLLETTEARKYFAEMPELLENVLYVDRTPLICEQYHRIPEYKKRMADALLEIHESAKNLRC